jgi:hypothetical protein
MINYTLLFICFILIACDDTIYHDYSDYGKASATIDGKEYNGTAYIYPKPTGDFVHKLIVLSFDDSTIIEIESGRFEVGEFSMNSYKNITLKMMVTGNSFYSAKEGILSIKLAGSAHVVGEFDIIFFDATSSCSDCPEDLIHANGSFNAVEEKI